MFVQWLYNVCTGLIPVHPVLYHEHAKPFSPQSISLSNAVHTRLYRVHTVHRHVHTVYRHVHTLYMGTSHFMHVPLWYMPFILACTTSEPPLDNAGVQESANVYIHCSDRDIPPKNGSGRY